MRRVVILGAGGRDFHNFNVVYRDDPEVEVVAFTATQIPDIAGRLYPPALAGERYPRGIPIHREEELPELIRRAQVDEAVFAYSDVTYEHVMHRAAVALSAGASFTLLGPAVTMLASERPVVSVCATRTGSGKSQTSREIARILMRAGLRVALVRHPMPYHDLDKIDVQRFATIADIDASNPTVEEREEYERPVELGIVVYAGVDYRRILDRAEAESEVIIWDGGNNDLPFFRPRLHIVVVDPLRAGGEGHYHPGEANLRMADVVLVNKLDSASADQLKQSLAAIAEMNPRATVLRAESPVTLADGPSIAGRSVLVIEDGPTITHGNMPFGAGTVAAQQHGALKQIDPRPYAVGSIAETFERYPHIGPVMPAMGYSPQQLRDLEATVDAVECDVVVTGTPIDLERLISCRHPIRRATYELRQTGGPPLNDVLAPVVQAARPDG
jgi:predicted GTPase